ncbi:2Fe-2S iron-sulfur cluster-binding protein [Vibrio ulleungensis]|jgi:ferredoxin|uniref:2Fe-2S iron-sulfur cluster binding domain-containing protein n=1 Tax=Vibrio ulleungensis TaxID=2807619 RepID=A0ABS2HJC9_9VIBR|nr:2Fe-2S iron-sulfur cluster-binding protein [Vibrio ulleungensis]MBM7035926.1 2Fe-2S iron-sulfur cluster binding domain-containing protein [Vibrio ulleungensis]
MHLVTLNKLTQIRAEDDQTLLEAMESSDLIPEYNCRDGHCGACRCTLDEGDVEYIGFAMAYLAPKQILPCICKAKSAVKISSVNYQLRIKTETN